MIKSCVRGNGESHGFGCDVCAGISARIFKIKYSAPKKDKRGAVTEYEEKEIWICPSCIKDLFDAIIDSRVEQEE